MSQRTVEVLANDGNALRQCDSPHEFIHNVAGDVLIPRRVDLVAR